MLTLILFTLLSPPALARPVPTTPEPVLIIEPEHMDPEFRAAIIVDCT